MTIETQRLPQINSRASLSRVTSEANKKPIDVGVDSHKIEFHLESPNTQKVQTVVGASFDSPMSDDFLAGIAPRLRELGTSGATLVSFASTNSFERLAQQNKPMPLRRNSTSIIERIQASLTSNSGNGLKLSDEVTVMGMTIAQRGTDNSGIPCLEGEIEIRFSDPQIKHKTIKFLEFSPRYDGHSLDENTLLNALEHVSNKTAAGVHPHFYSMNGVGRSASLSVLYSFKEMCTERNCGFKQDEVEGHLNSLINQGRQQRNEHFVNTAIQKTELLNACITLNKLVHTQQKRGVDEQPKQDYKHVITTPRVSKPAAVIALNTPPQKTIVISETIEKLATDKPASISNPQALPYMPINLKGIGEIVVDASKFPFPQVGTEQAKRIAKDVILAGFHGDALGADLEAKTYDDKKIFLFGT